MLLANLKKKNQTGDGAGSATAVFIQGRHRHHCLYHRYFSFRLSHNKKSLIKRILPKPEVPTARRYSLLMQTRGCLPSIASLSTAD